jgi:diadenosine tetraphosphate (Ap4A) HIT family hydrolase
VAIARVLAEREETGCLVCAILGGRAGPVHVLHEGSSTRTVLSRYPRHWGQTMVLVKPHITRFSELAHEQWIEATSAAYTAARRIEEALGPVRCFVSCLGTARTDLPMSCPHIHVHIDPIYDRNERPSEVFTLDQGVLEAEDHEWQALRERLAW